MAISELARTLLAKRGVMTEEAMEAFVHPDYEKHTHDPFLFEGMERAVVRFLAAIERKERIVIYADFDCDGIPGAALFSDFLKKIGYENAEIYLPHRDTEGHGFHKEAVSNLASRGTSLIVTIDVGTNADSTIQHAKSLGVDVIITDHHEVTGTLSECVAILNPKIGAYPFRELCGSGVAFKFVQALLREGKRRNMPAFAVIPEGWEKWLLDLVAIATIADMVPLVGENRVLTHFGLKVLRKSPRLGILALCNLLRLRRGELREDDVAFSIAPRINAASRMGEPDLGLTLLTTQDAEEADNVAAHLETLNSQRKGVVASVVRQARKNMKGRFQAHEKVVVLGSPEWKPALLGLAANSIMGERGGVVCLWGRDGVGRLKGSCRSDGSLSIVELFANAGGVFEEYGGHAKSGGFSVSHAQVHTLHDTLSRAAESIATKGTEDSQDVYDAITSLPEISTRLFEEVSQLAPFGIGNPKPVFQVNDIMVAQVRRFGRDSAHVEVQLECCRTKHRTRAFDFFRAPENFAETPLEGKEYRALATLERDTFRGGLALRLVDILPVR